MTTVEMPPGGFATVCVVGVGLIGGSIAAALKAVPNPPLVFGVDVSAGSLEHALEHGLVDEAALVDDACERGWFGPGEVSLVVVATPAQFEQGWLERLGSEGYDGVVTDVASTKGGVMRTARRELKPPARFVGGHPMAGSERSGIQAARADLFENAYWLLTPAAETDMDTSYAAWRLKTPVPYSIVAVTKVRAAKLGMAQWVEFLERHLEVKARFEYEVMRLMSEVMAHTITLHLLDAPGRLARFTRKHAEMAGRLPNKELASYLNLTPETLSRLKARSQAA